MTLRGDTVMFWRFARTLRFGSEQGVSRCLLDEARDEIASIARHTASGELRSQCEVLLDAYEVQRARDMRVVPSLSDLSTDCRCPHCGLDILNDVGAGTSCSTRK